MAFCRHLSVFLAAGVPLLDGLETVRTDTRDGKLREIIGDLQAGLRSGDYLSTAVLPHAKSLPPYFIGMLASAEGSGSTAEVLAHIAELLQREIEARRKIRGALLYPAIVVGLAIVATG